MTAYVQVDRARRAKAEDRDEAYLGERYEAIEEDEAPGSG